MLEIRHRVEMDCIALDCLLEFTQEIDCLLEFTQGAINIL